MLGWLGAAAAPILIHLWMRQTHRETAWAAVRFLRAALEKQARRLRLQHWLLLAVRTLLLVLVALAAAKPLLDSGLLSGGAPAHRVVVLDASLSMSALDADGETALEKAKRAAQAIAENTRAGDSVSLIVMGADAGAPLGRPISDASAASRAIDAVAPSLGVADLPTALATAQRLVDDDLAANASRRQQVAFLSDLGANTWSPAGETSTPQSEAIERLADSAELSVLDFGDAVGANVAITSLALADGLPTLAAPVEVRGEATLFGGTAAEHAVELLVDDAVVAERRVTLTPGQPTPIDFVHKFERGGPRSIRMRLADRAVEADRLPADNQRYAAVTLRPRVRVLCVSGSPGAAVYLADALDPSGEGVFEPVVVSDADLPSIDLSDFACVFLSNVRELSTREAERLREYAARGGGVAFFLGDRVSPLRYNEVLAPPQDGSPGGIGGTARPPLRLVANEEPTAAEAAEPPGEWLLPGWLSPSVAAPSYRVDPLDYTHPITRPFRGQQRAGLLNTPVMRHLPLEVPTRAGGVEVALALENGDPLLVTGRVGRGRVAVLTTAATLASIDATTGQPWTALPAWPSFLPIVRGVVRHLAREEGVGGERLIGDPIEGQAAPDALGDIAIRLPDGADPLRVAPDERGAWAYRATKRAGVYRYGPTGEPPVGATAINLDPSESDPASLSADRLPESITWRRATGDVGSAGDAASQPTPIHRWLIYGALALALIEPAMACRFGRSGG